MILFSDSYAITYLLVRRKRDKLMEIDGAQDSQNVPEEGNDEVYVPLEILVRAVQDARMESHVVGQIMVRST